MHWAMRQEQGRAQIKAIAGQGLVQCAMWHRQRGGLQWAAWHKLYGEVQRGKVRQQQSSGQQWAAWQVQEWWLTVEALTRVVG